MRKTSSVYHWSRHMHTHTHVQANPHTNVHTLQFFYRIKFKQQFLSFDFPWMQRLILEVSESNVSSHTSRISPSQLQLSSL